MAQPRRVNSFWFDDMLGNAAKAIADADPDCSTTFAKAAWVSLGKSDAGVRCEVRG